MIIQWKSEYIGNVGFEAKADDYDGVPKFSNYWLDASPKNRHADRQAVAAFLIFGGYMGGLTHMPQKFSPAVEGAFRRLANHVPTAFAPIEFYPKGLPQGTRTMHLSWTGSEVSPGGINQGAAFLRVERSDSVAGSMRTVNGLTVASNAWIHSKQDRGSLEQIYPYIAAAVLYAEDLEVDTIHIYGDFDKSSKSWSDLVYLLGSARLGITCGV